MRQYSKPNYLATVLDHQKSAALALPHQIFKKCSELNELTNEIKNLLNNCLPEDVLKTLWVGSYIDGKLTLSVQSQTAANHLRYQSNNLIKILTVQSLTFDQLKYIDVIVTYPASINQSYSIENNMNQQSNISSTGTNKVKSHTTRGLTESTRRTISHTAKHVINDCQLKKALERLAED